MKIRTGFVSNSSSSSFVMVGFEKEAEDKKEIIKLLFNFSEDDFIKEIEKYSYYSKDDKDDKDDVKEFCYQFLYEKRDECDFNYLIGQDDGAPKGKMVIGKFLCKLNQDDSYLGKSTTSILDITEEIKEIQKKFNENSDIKIYIGAINC